MASITRRQWVACLVIVGLILIISIYWPIGWRRAVQDRIRRRADWLDRTERELRALVRQPPPDVKTLDSPPWRRYDMLRFESGWAVGCVHNAHMDEDPTSLSSSLGDLVLLVDNQGRAVYSLRHVCDGSLPGALNEAKEDEEQFRNRRDLDDYVTAYSYAPPAHMHRWRWTSTRSDVLDDTKDRRFDWFPLWEAGGMLGLFVMGFVVWRRARSARGSTPSI